MTPASSIDRGDTTIAVAGDWHGNTRWAVAALDGLGAVGPKIRTLLHVGDFGLFRDVRSGEFLDAVEVAAARNDIVIWVTDGNHEDHHWRLALQSTSNGQPSAIRPHIMLLPRGYRWSHAGRTFLSLGGAPSVDAQWRTAGKDWWPEEFISMPDAMRSVEGGAVDVMVAHDAPNPATPKVDRIRASNPHGFPDEAIRYAAAGAGVITAVFEEVRPKVFFHGHYHVTDYLVTSTGQEIVSLNCDGFEGNLATLDLSTLEVLRVVFLGPRRVRQQTELTDYWS